MKLPNCDQSFIADEKITDYLLNLEHEKGRAKAKFFLSRGFQIENPDVLKNAMKRHSCDRDVFKSHSTPYGEKFVLRCDLATPDLENPCILSVWIVNHGEQVPRFVTAYPS